MRTMTRAFVLGAGMLFATPVGATHDAPRAAGLVKVDLVRTYAPCTSPNDVHDRVVVFSSACSPAAPLSAYTFGPHGTGKAQVQRTGNGVKLRFDLKDVRTAADAPADGVTFAARVSMRITDDGCSAAPSCTVETFLQIDVPCSAGRCFANRLFTSNLLPVHLDGQAEIERIEVRDDADVSFVTAGILLP